MARKHEDACATLCTDNAGEAPGCQKTHGCWCQLGRLSFAEIEDLCARDPELNALIMSDR